MEYYLTIDIGGTDIKYGIIDKNSNFVLKDKTPTPVNKNGNEIINKITEIYNTLKTYQISGIAISAAGIINPKTFVVENASDTIINYIGLDYKKELSKRIPNIKISVENDVNSVALYEAKLIENSNNQIIVAIAIGTGIGGAIVINNKLIHGSAYSTGEFGRMLINGQKYEDYASILSLIREAKKVDPSIKNGIDVFNAYDHGNQDIKKVVHSFFDHLTTGIVNIIFSINPHTIILGGGITSRGTPFLNELKSHLKDKLPTYHFNHTNIVLAKNKNDAGLLGAFENYKNLYFI